MNEQLGTDRLAVLITGAGGFLGSEIVRQALELDMHVRATDRMQESPLSADVEYVPADVLVPDSLPAGLQGMQCVIHAAGLAHIFDARRQTEAPFKQVNEIGTGNVARAAAEAGVEHLVLVSSVSVYGPFTQGAYDERAPCAPVGPYAESKYQAERRATELAADTGMRLSILRLATLYGEGDPGNVRRLIGTVDEGRFMWVGRGTNRKSLCHRQDAARACLTVADSPGAGIEVYNVSAPPCTMREVVEQIGLAMGCSLPGWHVPGGMALALANVVARLASGRGRFGSLELALHKWLANDVYDARKFRESFGFQTEVGLAEGIRREVDWYRQRTAPKSP